jgi:hypothetical protein
VDALPSEQCVSNEAIDQQVHSDDDRVGVVVHVPASENDPDDETR